MNLRSRGRDKRRVTGKRQEKRGTAGRGTGKEIRDGVRQGGKEGRRRGIGGEPLLTVISKSHYMGFG